MFPSKFAISLEEQDPVTGADAGGPLDQPDESRPETDVLRERIRALSAAMLHVSESLDFDTVLHEVLAGARALTGAKYGIIATVDDRGQLSESVTSGFTEEEWQRLLDWPGASRLFEHLRDLPSVLRLADVASYARSLGYSPDALPSKTMQATPMRHRDVYVGTFFLGEKEGGQEFTSEDEEVLLLFASQAATAIANARAYHNERQTRAHLEALVDTSPVGVAVFDAKTGNPQSLNREARRIVEELSIPGHSPEQVLEVLTCRLADGQEVTVDELKNTEILRAEEVVLSVPDGRSVSTLINATPVRTSDDETVSVVVTMQDLASLEEMERLGAEFLGMVSHELRAPLTSIKGSAATVLGAAPLDPAEMLQFFRIIDEQADHMRGLIGDLMDVGHITTGTLSVAPESAEVAEFVEQARNTFLSGGGKHAVVTDLPADLPRVMADGRRIVQVLNNLLSNASRHSPESSPIRITAARDGVHVSVSVSDEGRGIPPDRLPHLFRKYADGRQRSVGGSGLGLAICKGLVEAHGGRIRAESGATGRGTTFTFTIPVIEAGVHGAAGAFLPNGSRSSWEGEERTRILVVDDDPQTLRYVRNALKAAGYAARVTSDPGELSGLVETWKPQLVLLDLILPGTDGIKLMESVPGLASLPVIFVSGYGRDETVARALETGAADYIVKPFSPTELTARIAAALRRHSGPERFRLKDLAIDFEQRRVSVAGRPVVLTATEFKLLRLLSINAGRVLTYDALYRQIWGEQGSSGSALVRTFVKNLRRKLGDRASQPTYIHTERRVGYRMALPGDM